MSRTLVISALVAGLVAAATLVAPAGASEQRYLVVSDTPDGMIEEIVTESELDVELRCFADAPTAPSCQNGPLQRVFGATHGLVVPIPSGAGTPAGDVPVHKMIFTSILSGGGVSRIFRCEVNQTPPPAGTGGVTFTCFPGSGSFPPIGSMMTQDAIGLAATQGGAGDTVSLQVYQATGGEVIVPGVGKFGARLVN